MMKRRLYQWLGILALLLSACAQGGLPGTTQALTPEADTAIAPTEAPAPTQISPGTASPEQTEEPTPMRTGLPAPIPDEAAAAVEAAQQVVTTALDLPPEQVRVAQVEAVNWPDACLGVHIPNQACATAITPGYRIVLETEGRQYEMHTDQTGGVVRRATLGMEWTREGGIAGFCDKLFVYLPDQVYGASCTPGGMLTDGSLPVMLSADQLTQFRTWLQEYGEVQIVRKDPAKADALDITFTLHGFGQGQPDEATQQEMISFAQTLFGLLGQS